MPPRETHGRGRRRPGSAEAGFLLVEALTAMAISAVILLGLISSVAVMTRASERVAGMSGNVEVTTRAMDAIARDLTLATRIRWAGGGFVFAGDPSGLLFARRASTSSGIDLVTLSAAAGTQNRVLRSEGVLSPDAATPEDVSFSSAAEIYAGPLAMRFSFFARVPGGEEALLDAWNAAGEMPSGVRIAMIDPATGGIVSSRRISLMIDAEPGCAAPSTALCSYVANGEADALRAEDQPRELIDPNDAAGWMRYAR